MGRVPCRGRPRPVAFQPATAHACARSHAIARAVACAADRFDEADRLGRRAALLAVAGAGVLAGRPVLAAEGETATDVEKLANEALEAYNDKKLDKAYSIYTQLIEQDPDNPVWSERRGQVSVDAKNFEQAIDDFNAAQKAYQKKFDPKYVSLGLLSNRGLAHEGLYQWEEAIADYDKALAFAGQLGFNVPYVQNSRGNCYASLAARAESSSGVYDAATEWRAAREDYRGAARTFQRLKNLSGAIFATGNAALTVAQLGDDGRALKEMQSVARRAPGSIDMRAAVAAMLYASGDQDRAEQEWNTACSSINSGQLTPGGPNLDGCERYRDADWLRRIRRWPPVMVERMQDFIALRDPTKPANLQEAAPSEALTPLEDEGTA